MYFFFYLQSFNIASLLMSAAMASISVRRAGWLDRVVEYHKRNFYKDVQKVAPVQINVTIESMPLGYEDSSLWNYESVMQLLVLIRASETARPVHHALRRMLQPTRRYMSKQKSYKMFPSLMKHYKNDFYYDTSSEEYTEPPFVAVPADDAVIVVTNPVESRLPSTRISVKLLREILEARAAAARSMPTTTTTIFHWVSMNKTTATSASTTASDGGVDYGEVSGVSDTEAGSDPGTSASAGTTAATDGGAITDGPPNDNKPDDKKPDQGEAGVETTVTA